MSAVRVLYVLKRYPRLSETFIVREILGVEAAGNAIGIDALLPAEAGARHPDVERVTGRVRYLPATQRRAVAAHLRVALRHPLRWARLAYDARRNPERKAWRRFVQAGLVADRASRERFDHLHAHFATAAAEVAQTAAALAGLSFTVTAHAKDIFAAEHADHLVRRLAGAATVVTVSEHNRRHLVHVLAQGLGESAPPVVHIPNGMALPDALIPQPAGPVVCVARLVPKKGVDALIDALGVLATRYPMLHLELIGAGPLLADLQAQAERLGVGPRVTFRGALPFPEVADAYRRAALVALPCCIAPDGDRDGLPTVLVEAAGRGLPVVSTDVVGIGEVVISGRTGLLVPPGDPLALAEAIASLVADPARAAAMGAEGRRLVAIAFDPAAATARLLSVFSSARANAPGRLAMPGTPSDARPDARPGAPPSAPAAPARTAVPV